MAQRYCWRKGAKCSRLLNVGVDSDSVGIRGLDFVEIYRRSRSQIR